MTSACAQVPEGKTVAPLDLSYEDKVYYLLFDAALKAEEIQAKSDPNYHAFRYPICFWVREGIQNTRPSAALSQKLSLLVASHTPTKLASDTQCEDSLKANGAVTSQSFAEHFFVRFCASDFCQEMSQEHKEAPIGEFFQFYGGSYFAVISRGRQIWLSDKLGGWAT